MKALVQFREQSGHINAEYAILPGKKMLQTRIALYHSCKKHRYENKDNFKKH